MSVFDPRSQADVAKLVREHPLATLVSDTAVGFAATPLPLVAETDGEGRIVALIGHFGRSNPHLAAIAEDPRALAIFHGPQGYVSPRIVSKPQWGPTWNYAVARFQVEVTLTPERNDEALALLIDAVEGDGPGAWRASMLGERYALLAARIVSFRAAVTRTHATFKLGQDEDAATFSDIVEGLDDRALACLMLGQRRP